MVVGYDVGAAVFAAQHRVSKDDPSHVDQRLFLRAHTLPATRLRNMNAPHSRAPGLNPVSLSVS